jgi:hypothetical protein
MKNSSKEHAWSGYFWQQYEQGKIDADHIPVTEREKTLARLMDVWKTAMTEQINSDDVCVGSLEHACSSACSWKHVDPELSVCLDSNNYHVCTTAACRHRTSDSNDGHEICEITGRIREEVQYAVPTYGTRDGGGAEQVTFEATTAQRPGDVSTHKNGFSDRHRSFVEGVVYGIIQNVLHGLDQKLVQQAADLCVIIYYQAIDKSATTADGDNNNESLERAKKRQRVSFTGKDGKHGGIGDDDEGSDEDDDDAKRQQQQQSIFHSAIDDTDIYAGVQSGRLTKKKRKRRKHKKRGSKRLPSSLQIEKFCIVLLSDLAGEGVTIHVPNKQTKAPEPLQVIPPSATVGKYWPGTARLGDMWDIEVSKDVHASLTLMGATRLRALASIIQEKAYTLFATVQSPPSSSSSSSQR